MAQQYYEFWHCGVGLPWWGAIVAGTSLIRLLLLPLHIMAYKTEAQKHNNMPILQALQLKMTNASKTKGSPMPAKYLHDMMVLMKVKNINPIMKILVPLIEAPIFAGVSAGLAEMLSRPVESMKTGGMLRFADLTQHDPSFILPAITCTTIVMFVKMRTAEIPKTTWGGIRKFAWLLYSLIAFPLVFKISAGFHFYFATKKVMILGQTLLLRDPRVRRLLRIPKLVKHEQKRPPVFSKRFIQSVKDSCTNMKITREMNEIRRNGTVPKPAPIPKTYRYDPTKVSRPTTSIQAKSKSST